MKHRNRMGILALGVSLALAIPGSALWARGFGGGGFRGGGGFGGGGGGFRGGGGFGGGGGGFRGGYGGGGFGGGEFRGGGGFGGGGEFRGGGGFGGGYGGARTPSFSSPGSFERGGFGGASSGVRSAGMEGGQIQYGSRSGSYETRRGGEINYGAAGAGVRGPEGGAAGRGVYGVSGTTAGGREFGTVGRAGGAVGPEGGTVAGRSSIGAVSGPRGTAVGASRGAVGVGREGGVVAGGSRAGVAVGREGGVVAGGSRGVVAAGERGGAAWAHGASAFRPNGFNNYGAYHAGWVHGYWYGHNSAAWGWRNPYWGAWGLGLATGVGLGWGLTSWGYGSALYDMGYAAYANPYYVAVPVAAGGGAPYDYSQPIDTVSPPAEETVANPAIALFDAGRAAFQQGNYDDALKQTNDALAQLPKDTTLHEFRALCLFALGRYDESAATLYAVLSVGPGWDWTTLISLYPNVDVYTTQLRALEGYCSSHADAASGRFVLAYHYLTQGHNDAAVAMLREVVALKPSDTLSAGLIRQLDAPKEPTPGDAQPAAPAAPPAAPAPDDTTPPQGATIDGSWTAQPAPDTTVSLTLKAGGPFTWQVTRGGQSKQFTGTATYGGGVLTLAQASGPPLVGRVGWKDATHMTFLLVGDGPGDPGLSFAK